MSAENTNHANKGKDLAIDDADAVQYKRGT